MFCGSRYSHATFTPTALLDLSTSVMKMRSQDAQDAVSDSLGVTSLSCDDSSTGTVFSPVHGRGAHRTGLPHRRVDLICSHEGTCWFWIYIYVVPLSQNVSGLGRYMWYYRRHIEIKMSDEWGRRMNSIRDQKNKRYSPFRVPWIVKNNFSASPNGKRGDRIFSRQTRYGRFRPCPHGHSLFPHSIISGSCYR